MAARTERPDVRIAEFARPAAGLGGVRTLLDRVRSTQSPSTDENRRRQVGSAIQNPPWSQSPVSIIAVWKGTGGKFLPGRTRLCAALTILRHTPAVAVFLKADKPPDRQVSDVDRNWILSRVRRLQ